MPIEIVAIHRPIAPLSPKKAPQWHNHQLARMMLGETPRGLHSIPVNQLALMMIVEAHPLTISEIMVALGLARATASELVHRAARARRVRIFSSKQTKPGDKQTHKYTFVELAPRGQKERKSRTG
jgi:hypothetical protein